MRSTLLVLIAILILSFDAATAIAQFRMSRPHHTAGTFERVKNKDRLSYHEYSKPKKIANDREKLVMGQKETSEDGIKSSQHHTEIAEVRGKSSGDGEKGPEHHEINSVDPDVEAAYKELILARYKHDVEALNEKQSIISKTNTISYFICFVAHTLLIVTVCAAIGEYRQASRRRKVETPTHELQISLEGMSLKTSLHGTLLLLFAFAFYFMYVRFVYPITVIE